MSIQCDRLEINGQFAIEFIEVSGRRVGPYRSSAAFTLPAHRASSAALVAEQVIHSYLDDHYRRALDDPLPLLDGKTPRQAVKTKKGRAQVVGWLKLLENSEFRRAAGQGHNPYDTAWMWRELKVEDAR